MLKAEQLKQLESILKISGLADAITSPDEVAITLPSEGDFYTQEEISTLKNNEYKQGKEKGVEMAVKEVKEKQGLDFQGKTVDGLLDAFKKKVLDDAKIEPAEKVKELEAKLAVTQKTISEYEQTIAAKDSEVSSIKINTELYKYIPAPKEDGPALDQDDIIDMMRRKGYDYKLEGGKVVVYKDGQKMTDKVGNDLGAKDVVEGFLKERKLVTETVLPTGRGAGDGKQTAVFTKFSEIKAHFEAQGKSVNGEEFMNKVNELAKSPDFKMTE